MKKLWLVLATVALVGWTISSFADVQNIRLSGDIRLRGYYLNNVDEDNQSDDSFLSQRTRVTVEADLEDHVLVVVTLKAEGLWGAGDDVHTGSGAGADNGFEQRINRSWQLGVNEAYVQLNEVFYTPATLKLGRQYLHYGRGLIISSVEQEYNFDAARLVFDWYPFVLDLVGASLNERSSFSAFNSGRHDAYLAFANGRFELSDSIVKDLEVYAGYVINDGPQTSQARIPPSFGFASPIIVGGRVEVNPADVVSLWAEGAYEFGADGTVADEGISAFIANAGARLALGTSAWGPALNANYIYASGGGDQGKHTFRPWFDYMEGYNGYLFHPLLSNLHIFNLGLSVKPHENTTFALQGYYYLKTDRDSFAASNPNVDYGSTGIAAVSDNRQVGWELDAILGYDYSKDVRCQLVYGAFLPDKAVHNDTDFDAVAHEVRGEINVKF